METLAHYINGSWQAPSSGVYLDMIEPATGQVYGRVPAGNADDVALAVVASESAFPAWARRSASDRAQVLNRMADGIEANLASLAEAESKDNGKPVWLAKQVDIPRAALNLRFFASAIQHTATETHAMGARALNYTLRQPLGVVGCISPWNLPLYLFTWKIAPALAAGNCVVAKPSELTPMTAHLFSEICHEAGLPAGVLNIVHGAGAEAGAALVDHANIKAISFTGGTRTGATIARQAAPHFKKLSLELGGKNPTIVFADCDFDKMLGTVLHASFRNQGQICLCGSRIFVEEDLYPRFKAAFVQRTKALKVGDPNDPDAALGAVVSEAHMHKVLGHIDTARNEGGRILCGGHRVEVPGRCAAGYFIAPTVIEGLDATCSTNQEEIFGPVVTIQPFSNEDEVLADANSTRYGLAASVWTQHLTRAHRVAERLESGIVWVNCWMLRDLRTPFGGMKASGVGREGGFEALNFFTEPKNVCINLQ